MIVYHGTTVRRAERICAGGFERRKPSKRVWFAESRHYALARAKTQGRAMFLLHERLLAILRSLIAERRRQGLSLSGLAQRTCITKPNLSRLENSTTATPTLDTLERYARAVGKAVQVELVDAES